MSEKINEMVVGCVVAASQVGHKPITEMSPSNKVCQSRRTGIKY